MPAWAVELTGQVRGTIQDQGGLPVPGVQVELSSPALQGTRSVTSDASGAFRTAALPVGGYTVVASIDGMATVQVAVKVASGSVAKVQITMVAESEDVMLIEATAPVVDTSATRTGTVMSREMMRDIPNAGRDYQGAMNFAPGVVDNGSGNPNMRGGLSYGNQYYLDGVNTTDPLTNTFSMNMNFDAIEEVQVITGGMDAEYGRSMGGAVNIVTRSGGNEFHGDIQYLYSGTRIPMVYTPLEDECDETDEDGNCIRPDNNQHSIALNLGGPIIKDRLWFFTGTQMNHTVSETLVPGDVLRPEPMQSEKWVSRYLFGKLTYSPHADHRIWVQGQADPTNIDNASRDIYTLENAEMWWKQGGWLASAGHQWTPNGDTIVDTQLSTSSSYIRVLPMQWQGCNEYDEQGWCNSYETDLPEELGAWTAYDPDGFSYGPLAWAYYTERTRSSLQSSVTRFARFMGEHQLKAGVQAEVVNATSGYLYHPDGMIYRSHDGDPSNLEGYTNTLKYEPGAEEDPFTGLQGTLAAVYLQDIWQPIPNLSIRPGVRVDLSSMLNNLGEEVYSSLTYSPRLGLAWDPMGDGRTNVHAYYGRFYDNGFLEISSILSKDAAGGGTYEWNSQLEEWGSEPSTSTASEFLVHDDLRVPYSDELDLGVRRDVGGGWALGLNYTYEKSFNLIEDDEVNLIWNDEGTAVIGSRDGTNEARYRLRTPDEATIEYTSVEVSVDKQFDEKWGLLGSYTWSQAYGLYRDDLGAGLASYSFDNSQQQQYETGLMPYDIPHSIKLAGSYRDPHRFEVGTKTDVGYLFGWNFNMSSGYPYRPSYFNSNWYGWYNYKESLDGDYRLPAYARTDIKAGLTIAQGETTWDVTIECFNLFNSRTVTSVQTAADDGSGGPYLGEDGDIVFGEAVSRQSPRYIQLGLRGEF
jgi:hypothetical protein